MENKGNGFSGDGQNSPIPAYDDSVELDETFEPTIEMMVHEEDDEATLDEQESAEPAETQTVELDDLIKEGELPLDELLKMYGYMVEGGQASLGEGSNAAGRSVGDEPPSKRSKILFPCDSKRDTDSESDDDDSEEEYSYKAVKIGPEHQADVPNGITTYGEIPPYENEDHIIWDPNILTENEVESFQLKMHAMEPDSKKIISFLPAYNLVTCPKKAIKDSDAALFLLTQSGYNVVEALRRKALNRIPTTPSYTWSKEEAEKFENGLCIHGKDFSAIYHNEMRSRSVKEMVQFYYYWKKSDRREQLFNRLKSDEKNKKQYMFMGPTEEEKEKEWAPMPTSMLIQPEIDDNEHIGMRRSARLRHNQLLQQQQQKQQQKRHS